MILFHSDCKQEETCLMFLAIYACFIAIFFVGMTKDHFMYKINIKFLTEPLIVSILTNHFVMITFMVLFRIDINN
jgi:hypothetical protein